MFGNNILQFLPPSLLEKAKADIEAQKEWENKDERFNKPKIYDPVSITVNRKVAAFNGGTAIILTAIALVILSKQ